MERRFNIGLIGTNLYHFGMTLFTGGPILPDKFKPLTDLRSIYDRINSGFINEKDNLILKLIWDSLAITEAQIKNFVESKISRSQVSESLKNWHCMDLLVDGR